MALRDGLLVDAQMGDALLAASGQAALHRSSLDAPGLIPRDPQQAAGAGQRAFPQQVDRQSLEERGELRAWFRPRNADLPDTVDRTLDSGHVRLDPGRELHGVQMSPPARLAVVAGPGGAALGAHKGPCAGVDLHHHALPAHVQLDAHHRPRRGQPQDRPVELDVAHRSDPPSGRSEHSWFRSPTHTIPGRAEELRLADECNA